MSSSKPAAQPANTTSQVTNTTIPTYLQPYATAMLGGAMNQAFTQDASGNITGTTPYTPFSAQSPSTVNQALGQASQDVAGFTPLQNQAFTGAANLQTPGQYNTATGMADVSGLGSLGIAGLAPGLSAGAQGYGSQGLSAGLTGMQNAQNTANAAFGGAGVYGGQGAGYGQQGAGYGAQAVGSQNQLINQIQDPGTMQNLMSTFMDYNLPAQQQLLAQQTGIQGAQEQSAATSSGAFGGSREALANALNQQAGNIAQSNLIGNAYNTAYTDALNALTQNVGQNIQRQGLGIQGAQTGIAGAQTGLQGVGQQISAGNLGLQGANTAIQGAQTGLQGIQGATAADQLGLQGYGQAGTEATNLANIGTQQLGAQQGILGLQSQMGGTQQQQNQNIINQAMTDYSTAQQYPYQQYSFLSDLLHGLPVSSTTTQNYMAAPNAASTTAGLGIAGLGLSNALSDVRTKQNIQPVGRLKNGITLFEFNYKPEFGDPSVRYRGVMAQEVERVIPDAVGVLDNGYKYVNYDMVGTRMEAV